MRLRTPRVDHVQSDDGSAVLTYEGLDTSHDLGGSNYLLRVRDAGEEAEVRARIRTVTYSDARDAAEREGLNFSAMSSDERREYQQRFADEFGNRMEVILFEIVEQGHFSLEDLVRRLCIMYLEMKASYKYNHPDYPGSGEGYYPDQIYFCPYDVDRKLYVTIKAGEQFHD